MEDIDLTPLERRIVERASNLGVTRRRRAVVLLAGVAFACLLVVSALLMQSWKLVLAISIGYIAITVLEKVAYANAVLAYKGVIQKLKKRLAQAEPEDGSQPTDGSGRGDAE